jgi:hypothetical protein
MLAKDLKDEMKFLLKQVNQEDFISLCDEKIAESFQKVLLYETKLVDFQRVWNSDDPPQLLEEPFYYEEYSQLRSKIKKKLISWEYSILFGGRVELVNLHRIKRGAQITAILNGGELVPNAHLSDWKSSWGDRMTSVFIINSSTFISDFERLHPSTTVAQAMRIRRRPVTCLITDVEYRQSKYDTQNIELKLHALVTDRSGITHQQAYSFEPGDSMYDDDELTAILVPKEFEPGG